MYLERAGESKARHVWIAVGLTIGAPLAAAFIGYHLLRTIRVDAGSTAYSAATHALVRAAVTQALDRDLAADRIQEVLTRTDDPAPGTDAQTRTARVTARAVSLKTIAARLNTDRARLADTLTVLAMNPHPSKDDAVRLGKEQVVKLVRKRLDDDPVRERTKTWVATALDPHTRHLATLAVKGAETTIAQSVADSVALDALRLNVDAAVAPKLDPFDPRTSESGWTKDVSARLAWGVVSLVFCMTFGMVLSASAGQILKIAGRSSVIFFGVSAVVAAAAGYFAHSLFNPADVSTPLHRALNDYAELFDVGIVRWASAFNWMRAIGVVLLVGGSLATFLVKLSTKSELEEQLRGFKALFNAGAVFLLAGVLEVYALFRWPVIFAADEAARTALQGAAATFAAATGAMFSVVLLSAYLATTVALRHVVTDKVTADEVDAALQKFGFGDLTSQQAMRPAQALVPLLPGFVSVLG